MQDVRLLAKYRDKSLGHEQFVMVIVMFCFLGRLGEQRGFSSSVLSFPEVSPKPQRCPMGPLHPFAFLGLFFVVVRCTTCPRMSFCVVEAGFSDSAGWPRDGFILFHFHVYHPGKKSIHPASLLDERVFKMLAATGAARGSQTNNNWIQFATV